MTYPPYDRLPPRRCILSGMGYGDDVKAVDAAGWPGFLAYHFYPMWMGDGLRMQVRIVNRL